MPKKKPTTTTASLPLVAIDLGSNGVRAIAAQRMDTDLLRILGVEQSQKYPAYMERGVVTQSSYAGFMIREVLRLLANRINVPDLPTAFLLTGGRSMQIVPVSAHRDQVRLRPVTKELLEGMEHECRQKIETRNHGVGVLGLVPSYYVLDGKEYDTCPPEKARAIRVESHYIAFVGRQELTAQIQKSFDQSGKSVESAFVRPEALLSTIAAQDGYDMLQRGCAVLDMGAQTTTLTLYKGGSYLYNKVVPQGSYHITRAIAQQGIAMELAERLKCEYGYASPEQVEKELRLRVPASDEAGGTLLVMSSALAELIKEKLEEILEPLLHTLQEYADRIPVLYITGGGSMLQGFDKYLESIVSQRVMYTQHDAILTSDVDEQLLEPRYTSLIGALLLGADFRDSHQDTPIKTPSKTDRIYNVILDIFSDQNY